MMCVLVASLDAPWIKSCLASQIHLSIYWSKFILINDYNDLVKNHVDIGPILVMKAIDAIQKVLRSNLCLAMSFQTRVLRLIPTPLNSYLCGFVLWMDYIVWHRQEHMIYP